MYSLHAEKRLQQRGIQKKAVDIVIQWGEVEFHRGCQIYSVSRDLLRVIGTEYPEVSKKTCEKLSDLYVVAEGDFVVTAAYRLNRHKRNRK